MGGMDRVFDECWGMMCEGKRGRGMCRGVGGA